MAHEQRVGNYIGIAAGSIAQRVPKRHLVAAHVCDAPSKVGPWENGQALDSRRSRNRRVSTPSDARWTGSQAVTARA
jgi:hypothetical protein